MRAARFALATCAGMLLLALAASASLAAGVSVSWKNFCWGEDGSRENLTWTCNSNTNDNIRMTCSFKLDAAVPDFVGAEVYLEGMTEAPSVPDWWKLGETSSGDCRAGLITLSADGSVLGNGGTDICFDPWRGLAGGGIGLYSWDGNRMHVNAVYAMADAVPLEAAVEYFAMQLRISAEKTVGACTGCLIPAVWMLWRINVCTPTTTLTLDSCYEGGSNCLSWQNSMLPCALYCNPDPVRNTTWGQVKSLYR